MFPENLGQNQKELKDRKWSDWKVSEEFKGGLGEQINELMDGLSRNPNVSAMVNVTWEMDKYPNSAILKNLFDTLAKHPDCALFLRLKRILEPEDQM